MNCEGETKNKDADPEGNKSGTTRAEFRGEGLATCSKIIVPPSSEPF